MCARRRAHPAQAGRPESRHPPPSPTCPSARPAHHPYQHPSSTLCSVTHTHTHTLPLSLSLSPAVCQSLSPTVSLSLTISSEWPALLSSLLSSFYPSATLLLPPPAVRATRPGSGPCSRLHLPQVAKDLRPANFFFSFFPFFFLFFEFVPNFP